MSNISETTFSVQANVKSRQRVASFSHVFIESASDDFEISFGNSSTVIAHQSKSIPVGGIENEIYITSSTAQAIRVQMSMEPIQTGRSSVVATVNTTIEPSNTINNPGDVSAGVARVQAIAANVNRKEVELAVPSSQPFGVRVGNATVTNASGSLIEPGTSKVFGVEAALYVIRESGATSDATVTVLEMERP